VICREPKAGVSMDLLQIRDCISHKVTFQEFVDLTLFGLLILQPDILTPTPGP